ETSLETTGMQAEAETGGVQVNYVPKDGGNSFHGTGTATFSSHGMQSTNLTDALRSRGLTSAAHIDNVYDFGAGAGGPLKRDRLWFYATHRKWGSKEFQPGAYFNATPNTPFYTADLSQQGYTDNPFRDTGLRVTWQAAQRHKIAISENYEDHCFC